MRAEPILHAYGTIKEQDAILAWDKQELLRDENGVPLSRWDGETTRLHRRAKPADRHC